MQPAATQAACLPAVVTPDMSQPIAPVAEPITAAESFASPLEAFGPPLKSFRATLETLAPALETLAPALESLAPRRHLLPPPFQPVTPPLPPAPVVNLPTALQAHAMPLPALASELQPMTVAAHPAVVLLPLHARAGERVRGARLGRQAGCAGQDSGREQDEQSSRADHCTLPRPFAAWRDGLEVREVKTEDRGKR